MPETTAVFAGFSRNRPRPGGAKRIARSSSSANRPGANPR